MGQQATCRLCGKSIWLSPSQVKPRGTFCSYTCRSWYRVEQHLNRTHPVSLQIFRAGIEVGRQIGVSPGVGSLRELHKRSGISEPHLSWYVQGKHLGYPTQANLDRLRKLTQNVLGESLRWQGITDEERDTALAKAGATRFSAQTRAHRAKLRKKAAKTMRGRPQRRPQTTPAYEAYWARLRTQDHAKLHVQGRLLTAGARAGLASAERALGRPLTPDESEAFIRNYSKKHSRPAAWVRAALSRTPGHRPKAIDHYDIIRAQTWRGCIEWPSVFQDIELLEGRKLDAVEKENLRRSYRREQRRLEAAR